MRRRVLWPYPEAWAYLGVLAAWVLLLRPGLEEPARLVGAGHHAHGTASTLLHAAVMTVAMMVPLVLPTSRWLAQTSLWHRRHRSVALHLSGFVLTWSLIGASMTAAADAMAAHTGRGGVLLASAVVAVTVQGTPGRRRRLAACAARPVLAPTGTAADRDCVAFGIATARACIAACWGLMLLATAAHGAVVMAAVLAFQLAERSRRYPARLSLEVERFLLRRLPRVAAGVSEEAVLR